MPTKAQLQSEVDRLTLELTLHAECDPNLADRCRRVEAEAEHLREMNRMMHNVMKHHLDAQRHLMAAYDISSGRPVRDD